MGIRQAMKENEHARLRRVSPDIGDRGAKRLGRVRARRALEESQNVTIEDSHCRKTDTWKHQISHDPGALITWDANA